uniref:SWI/SNF complex subunit SMARCC1-like n=1 Tax=Gasterosteus aculeatus aculeatus TaxID=481459 RepID=UPI001A99C45C|nr:SWI/SNF complex subunit SMARCC1-like [Gasterosteus aculeatus aculeatus]
MCSVLRAAWSHRPVVCRKQAHNFPPLTPKLPFLNATRDTSSSSRLSFYNYFLFHLFYTPSSLFHDFWPVTMAYKSRFSFWEKKVKVENKPDSDGDSSQPQAAAKSGLDPGSGAQSAVSSAEESNRNAAMGGSDSPGEEQSSSGKKVVRVVRRVVRNEVPALPVEQNLPAASAAAKAASAADSQYLRTGTAARQDKDDISMGLTSLMGRGKTKEHRPRTRTQERKEDTKKEAMEEEEGKGEVEQEDEKAAVEKNEVVTSVLTAGEPNPAPPKFNPLTPPAGFIPAPKHDPLAPPAGFIPLPKQNLMTPPPGFIPARKSSAGSTQQNPLARPPGFIPVQRTDPLAPPAGFIPKPRLVAVRKPEGKETPCPPAAPDGKPPPVALPPAQSAPNEQACVHLAAKVPELVPSEEDYKRMRRIFATSVNDVTCLFVTLLYQDLPCYQPVDFLAPPDKGRCAKRTRSTEEGVGGGSLLQVIG